MIVTNQRYAFFELDEELRQYCLENMHPEYEGTPLACLDGHILRINCNNKFVFPKPTIHYKARQRPFLPKEEFFNIAAITDSDAKSLYITQLYQEQFEALKE